MKPKEPEQPVDLGPEGVTLAQLLETFVILAERRVELLLSPDQQSIRVLVNGIEVPVAKFELLAVARGQSSLQSFLDMAVRIRLANGEAYVLNTWRIAADGEEAEKMVRNFQPRQLKPEQLIFIPQGLERVYRLEEEDV